MVEMHFARLRIGARYVAVLYGAGPRHNTILYDSQGMIEITIQNLTSIFTNYY